MEGEGIKGFLPLKEGEGKDREGARGKRREKEGQGREVKSQVDGSCSKQWWRQQFVFTRAQVGHITSNGSRWSGSQHGGAGGPRIAEG